MPVCITRQHLFWALCCFLLVEPELSLVKKLVVVGLLLAILQDTVSDSDASVVVIVYRSCSVAWSSLTSDEDGKLVITGI
jgi:hypothetical protein